MLRYYLKFKDEGWTEVSSLVRSTDTSPFNLNLCSTAWLGLVNTASFNLRYTGGGLYRTVATKLITAQSSKTDVECRIILGDDVMFHGLVNAKKLSLSTARLPESIGVSCNDMTVRLEEKLNKNKVFGVGEKLSVVVDWLLTDAGLSAVAVWPEGVADTLMEVPFVSTEDDGTTYLDYINRILQETGGYVLVSNPRENRLEVRALRYDGSDDVETVHYRVSDRLKSTSSLFANDGVVVKYGNVKTSRKELVYMDNISLSDGILLDPNANYNDDGSRIPTANDGNSAIPLGTVIPVGGYYPKDADVSKTFQEYDASLFDYAYQQKQRRTQNSDMGLYYVKPDTVSVRFLSTDKQGASLSSWYENVGFYSSEGKFTYPGGGEYHPRKAWQVFHNKSGQCVNVQSFIMEGVAVYSDRVNRLVMPVSCKDPFEYESSYIASEGRAAALAALLTNVKKHGGDTTTWTAPWSAYDIGQTVYVEHVESAKVRSLVVKKSFKVIGGDPWCEYVAVHMDGWEDASGYSLSGGSASASSTDPYTQAVANGFTGNRDDYEKASKTLVQYGTSTDPESYEGVEWTDEQIPTSSITAGKYLWMRTSTDGGTTWVYTRITPDASSSLTIGEVTPYTITRNDNETGTQTITFTASIVGYPDTFTPTWLFNGETKTGATVSYTLGFSLSVSEMTVKLYDGDVEKDSLTLTVKDLTRSQTYLGKASSTGELTTKIPASPKPGVTYTFLWTGDETVWGDVTLETNTPYWYNGTRWQPYSGINESNVSVILSMLNDADKGDNSGVFAWFNNIVASVAVIKDLFANKINIREGGAIYGGGYGADGTSSGADGFHISSDGIINATGAKFKGIEISGASTFGGEITSTSLSTVNGDPSAGDTITLSLGSTSYWNYDEFEGNVSAKLSDGYGDLGTGSAYASYRKYPAGQAITLLSDVVYTHTPRTVTIPANGNYTFQIKYCSVFRNGHLFTSYTNFATGTNYFYKGDVIGFYTESDAPTGQAYAYLWDYDNFGRDLTFFDASGNPVGVTTGYRSDAVPTVIAGGVTVTTTMYHKWGGNATASGGGTVADGGTVSFVRQIGANVTGKAIRSVLWRSTSSLEFTFTDGTSGMISTSDYFKSLSGSFKVLSKVDSVVAATILPKDDAKNLGGIGESETPWNSVFAKNVRDGEGQYFSPCPKWGTSHRHLLYYGWPTSTENVWEIIPDLLGGKNYGWLRLHGHNSTGSNTFVCQMAQSSEGPYEDVVMAPAWVAASVDLVIPVQVGQYLKVYCDAQYNSPWQATIYTYYD